jgi:AraC-type transcriptional regulator N-terminus
LRKQAVNQAFENNSMEVALEALGKSIARWTDKGGLLVTAISALSLSRRDAPTQPTSYMYEPSICLIAQGAKRVLLGDDTYVLDVHHFLITSVDLPTVVQIIQASREKPYLGLILKLDRREISQLMVDSNLPAACAAIKPWNGDRRGHVAAAHRLSTVDRPAC